MTPVTPFDVFFVIVAAALGIAVGALILGFVATIGFIAWSLFVSKLASPSGRGGRG